MLAQHILNAAFPPLVPINGQLPWKLPASLVAIIVSLSAVPLVSADESQKRMQPFWIGVSEDSGTVAIAGREGSICLLTARGRVHNRTHLDGPITDCALVAAENGLLALSGNGRWSFLDAMSLEMKSQGKLSIDLDRLISVNGPLSNKREPLFVGASCWGRCLQRFVLEADPASSEPECQFVGQRLDLSFCPHHLVVSPCREWLVVPAKFTGEIALIHLPSWTLKLQKSIRGHNLGHPAFSPSGETLAIPLQDYDELAPMSKARHQDRIAVLNQVLLVDWKKTISNDQKEIRIGKRVTLNELTPKGTADPTAVRYLSDDQLLVACHGSHMLYELDLSTEKVVDANRVGAGPCCIAQTQGKSLVACEFDGTIMSIGSPGESEILVDLTGEQSAEWSALGRSHFFDAQFSVRGDVSCHSCHPFGHTNGRLADTLGDGQYGAAKLVPSLLGTHLTDPWGWYGNVKELGTQVDNSVRKTLHGEISAAEVRNIKTFLFSLEPPPTIASARGLASKQIPIEGEALFRQVGCANCHIPPLTFSTNGSFEVGTVDKHGHRTFNPPSLRGITQRSRFLHDGRAATVREVLEDWNHPESVELSDDEIESLLDYLRTL